MNKYIITVLKDGDLNISLVGTLTTINPISGYIANKVSIGVELVVSDEPIDDSLSISLMNPGQDYEDYFPIYQFEDTDRKLHFCEAALVNLFRKVPPIIYFKPLL